MRESSQTELALAAALAAAAHAGADTIAFAGRQLVLPIYAPGSDMSPAAQKLVAALRICDGVIVSTPSYHGGISGMIKNALDYAEELRDDTRPYLHGRAVGAVVCAAGWQNVGTTLVGIRSIIHALRGWPTPMGVGINTQKSLFEASGACIDETALTQLEVMVRQVVKFAEMQMMAQRAWRPDQVENPKMASADFRKAITVT